ncbi:muscular LMNA-interacting protein isoform X2 [Hemitrygon akajei]|uniref:muscular LMNA-interacting protein isoform X2 n=1 Tax=Hemitrygon akajei TaxID=2704970 RepID=UPI003BF9EAC3
MVFKKKSHICLDQSTVTVLVSQKINKQENGTLDILETLMNPLLKEKKGQCSVMKSMVRINETAKPLAFTFVPTVRRLPAHIQVMDTRFSHQPGKLQSSMASSSILNEPLCITEEEQSGSFRVEDGIVEGASNRSWLNNEGNFGPAEEASQIQGIFKAEFVLLTDSDGNDSDCFSQGDGVDLSATALSLSSLTPNPFTDDKGSFVHPNVVEDKTKVPFLQDAEQKLDGAVQESLFQSCSPHSASIHLLTSTIQNGDSTPTDKRHACLPPALNKATLHFISSQNTEKKSSSLPRSSFLSTTENSFLSSSSLPSALHTKSLSHFNPSVTISKAASLPYPLSQPYFTSCSDLHSSPVWSSSSLPSSRSTVDSSTCVQPSPCSSSQNFLTPISHLPSCHCSRMTDSSCLHTNSAKSSEVSSPPTQLSLLTSILRSGKLTPVSSESSGQSTIVSSNTSVHTIGSGSSIKSSTSQTSHASPPCQRARTFSPKLGASFQDSSREAENVSSVLPRSSASPLFPKLAASSFHSSSTPLSKRSRNSSRERAQTPPPRPSAKHKAGPLKAANSTPMLSSLCHDSKPPISPHSPSSFHRVLSPGPVPSLSPRPPIRQEQECPLPSRRSLRTPPTSRISNLNYCPGKFDRLSLSTTSSSVSVSTSPFNTLPTLEQSTSPSPPSPSSSTLVNLLSSSSSVSNKPTPSNINPSTASLTRNQTSPHLSPLKPGSHSTALHYSCSPKPPIPQQLSCQPSPPAKFNDTVNTSAQSAGHFLNPSTHTPLPDPVKPPPPSSPTPRSGTFSPTQFLSRPTETKKPEQQYKIKSSYKVFAAIPTNTLLLDQKAIDEAVNDLGETTTQSTSKEMHSQFLYEPGSLRQQSEELYATIEQVLEDPLPSHCTGSSLRSPPRPLDSEAHKANLHLPSPKTTENQPTRPGVIRPVTALQKVPSMLEVDDICSNPFRQHTDETNNSEIKECLFPLSAILSSVSRPSVCYEMYQTMSCSQDMLQSVPLSLSPVTCLTSGSHIRFSPIAPCNYYMTSNLSRSLHSLYIKPRHSITTIHENEALGNTELPTATEKPNKVLLQRPGTERGSGKLVKDYGGRGREDLETLEKGKERAVK